MILLWDSSAYHVQMILVDGEQQYRYDWEAGRSLAKDMLQYIHDRLAEHRYTLEDITGIGIMRGPGSFTGLRIGLTVLNTLASAKRIPIVGANGSDWQDSCIERLKQAEDDQIVMPEYGAEAHVTAPRK